MAILQPLFKQPLNLQRSAFARRSRLPLRRDYLWKIESGVVRTYTYRDNGTILTLGIWGKGDAVSRLLSSAEVYYIECLTVVEANELPLNQYYEVNQVLIQHIQQMQEFLEIVQCYPVEAALLKLLTWLGKKFGQEVNKGQLIDVQLTHQELAETLGVTRVTVTRLLKDFEKSGIIERLPRRFILLHEPQPLWHYEI